MRGTAEAGRGVEKGVALSGAELSHTQLIDFVSICFVFLFCCATKKDSSGFVPRQFPVE